MKTCVYCKQEDDNNICISCDGKHSARSIYKKLNIERMLHHKKYDNKVFNEQKVKASLIEKDILGLEGLSQDERRIFFGAFDIEWSKLKMGGEK